ncbi:diguanylate cyclase domain-containing protein [Thalassococcus lentus]|uniref:guanylate cyclase n=1 Tax=Thalassococcus lentus TaxID=1210524 RepID=A0ABT4XWT7_9RHOB|nr:diguanylate cyclase [Thalassococcus lentus]MDA7426393.1 diguanylate cyclase [Thalassococcus lentus]
MTISRDTLHTLCPLHALLDRHGRIVQAGPTLIKLFDSPVQGERFLDLFEVYRPRAVTAMAGLLQTEGRKLHLRIRLGKRTSLKGVLFPAANGGALINLSFGIAVVDAVRDFSLTGNDFAITDLAIEMLYLVEAKSAAMDSSRRLNTRLQGARLAAEEQAFTDTLTGLKNRRALDHILERLKRTGSDFTVIHLDLDFFKQVNDTDGHAAGDRVLQCVARTMVELTRKDDTVARVGGDEFVIVLPNAMERERLQALCSQLIQRIEAPILHDGKACHVSASIGIARTMGKPVELETLSEQADIALYASKRAGRARFTFFDDTQKATLSQQTSAIAGE